MSKDTGCALAGCWMGRWSYAAFRETMLLFSVFVYFLITTTWSVKWNHPALQPCKGCKWITVCNPFSLEHFWKRTSAVWVHWEKSSYKQKSILFGHMDLSKMKIKMKRKFILQLSQWVTAGRGNPYFLSLFCRIFSPTCHVMWPCPLVSASAVAWFYITRTVS